MIGVNTLKKRKRNEKVTMLLGINGKHKAWSFLALGFFAYSTLGHFILIFPSQKTK